MFEVGVEVVFGEENVKVRRARQEPQTDAIIQNPTCEEAITEENRDATRWGLALPRLGCEVLCHHSKTLAGNRISSFS